METNEFFIAVYETGGGHYFRASKLAEALLERGHTVTFFTSHPEIKERFSDRCEVYECTPVRWYEDRTGINPILSAANKFFPLLTYDFYNPRRPLYWKKSVFSQVMSRYFNIRKYANYHMRKYRVKPKMVISESDPIMCRFAQRHDLDLIFIANALRPYYNLLEKFLFQLDQRIIEINYLKELDIAAPDFEMPYTICEYNLRGTIGVNPNLECVGPYVKAEGTPRDKDFIYFSINGPLANMGICRLKKEEDAC